MAKKIICAIAAVIFTFSQAAIPSSAGTTDTGTYVEITTAPTCTETGVGIRHLVTGSETFTVAPLGHDWGAMTVVESTSSKVTYTRSCARCGETETVTDSEVEVTNFACNIRQVLPEAVIKDGVISPGEYDRVYIPEQEIVFGNKNQLTNGDNRARAEAIRSSAKIYLSYDAVHGLNIAAEYDSPGILQNHDPADYYGHTEPTDSDPSWYYDSEGNWIGPQDAFMDQTAFAVDGYDQNDKVFYYVIGKSTETGEYLRGHWYGRIEDDLTQYGYDSSYRPADEDMIITYDGDHVVMEWSIPLEVLTGTSDVTALDGFKYGMNFTLTQGISADENEESYANTVAVKFGSFGAFENKAAKPKRKAKTFYDPVNGKLNEAQRNGNLPMVLTFVCDGSYVAAESEAPAHVHTYETVRVEPTCLENGYSVDICSGCGEETNRVVLPALGHDYAEVVTAPTCTDRGFTTLTCTRCGDNYIDDYVDALGHDFGKKTVTVEPTCTGRGVETRYCPRCGQTEEKEIDALGHDYAEVVTDPTCTEQGFTTWTCSRCGDSYVDGYVDALGHDFGDWVVTTEPTCTDEGVGTRYCSRCDASEERAIDALGHNYESAVTEPTCSEQGFTTWTCSRCGDSYVDNYVDALAHDWDDGVVALEPTEESEGTMLFTCRRCGEQREEIIPALDHVHVYETVVTDPTCTERGYTTYTCVKGDDSYVDDYVDALGHDFGDWVVTTEPTCTDEGVGTRYCSRCDASEERAVDALGHNFGDWTVTTEPTCTDDGVETRYCSRCDATEKRAVDSTGHDYEAVVTDPTCTEQGFTAWTCSRCGDVYIDGYADSLGHDWDDGVVTTEPTEETEGVRVFTCRRCGEQREEIIPALDHVHVYEAVVTDPTCTERGYTTYTCVKGDDSYIDDYVEALGHDYVSVVTDPTCTEQGFTTLTCSRCGDSYIDGYVDALGHDFGDWAVTTAPNCTDEGVETRYCSRCDVTEERESAALGHGFGDWVVTTEPTCTDDGVETRYCSRCDAYEERDVASTGHNYVDALTLPTCTDGGFTTHTCSKCSDSYVDNYIDAMGHDWDGGVVTLAPTETAEGSIRYTCRRCGEIRDEVLPALDHKPGDITGDGIVNTKDLLRLLKYVSGVDVEVQESALDVNGDGIVNSKDLMRLLKYLAGSDVMIF